MTSDKSWHDYSFTYSSKDRLLEASGDGRLVLRKYQHCGTIDLEEIRKAAEGNQVVDLTQQVVLDAGTLFCFPNRPLGPLSMTIRQRLTASQINQSSNYRKMIRRPKGKVSRW